MFDAPERRRPPRPLRRLRGCWLIGSLPGILELDHRSVGPQALQVVVVAVFFLEDVHDEIDVVQEDPHALPLALSAERLYPVSHVEGMFDLFCDRPYLPVIVPATYEEVVGDNQLIRDIQDRDPLGFLARSRGRGCEDQFLALILRGSLQRVRRKSFPTTIVRSTIPCVCAETCT